MVRAAAGPAHGPAAPRSDLARRWLGETDYAIPRFGFTSAAVICASLVLAVFVVPAVSSAFGAGPVAPAVAAGLLVGFSCAVMQFFHETDRGPCAAFWLVGLGLSGALTALFLILFA